MWTFLSHSIHISTISKQRNLHLIQRGLGASGLLDAVYCGSYFLCTISGAQICDIRGVDSDGPCYGFVPL